ncbi:hypothetical protein SS50377_24789 [Spironucleus salmonicida]|uniref:Uncharacterized protein n=1 Tax=Spironucleus salmonicida TaxID=348837 RepID=V6LK24_9EUKA|nr:hypothetical protein SS50377_24789 [Spironucleus salmonicida]|eukprot:EST44673.1 Hypothetical protein SS50377_15450 [Spironucleus salmonicida]
MRYNYEIDLKQIYLQEYTQATHLVVVIYSSSSYAYQYIPILRKCQLEYFNFKLSLDSPYQQAQFIVVKELQKVSSQLCQGVHITDLFRCPVEIFIELLQEESMDVQNQFIHVNIPNIIPFQEYQYESESDGIVLTGNVQKVQEFKNNSVSLFVEAELPSQKIFRILGIHHGFKIVLFEANIGKQGYIITQPFCLENLQIEAVSYIRQQNYDHIHQLCHTWPIQHAIYSILPYQKYEKAIHTQVSYGNTFLTITFSSFKYEQAEEIKYLILDKVSYKHEEVAFFCCYNIWDISNKFIAEEVFTNYNQQELHIGKVEVFVNGQIYSINLLNPGQSQFIISQNDVDLLFSQKVSNIRIEDETISISDQRVASQLPSPKIQCHDLATIFIENSSVVPYEIDIIPYIDRSYYSEDQINNIQQQITQLQFQLKLYNKAHETVKLNKLKQDVLIFSQTDMEYFQQRFLPVSLDSVIVQKVFSSNQNSQQSITFSSSDLQSVLKAFSVSNKIKTIQQICRKLQKKYSSELDIVEQELIIQKLMKLIEKIKSRKRSSGPVISNHNIVTSPHIILPQITNIISCQQDQQQLNLQDQLEDQILQSLTKIKELENDE